MGARISPQPIILGASAVAVVAPAADTNENILATINIAAGVMSVNGILRIVEHWSMTNNVNTKTLRTRLGGIGGTVFGIAALASVGGTKMEVEIANRGAANSQVGNDGPGGGWGSSVSVVTASVDTSVATTLVITGQKATGTDTLTLERYVVELLLP